VHQIVEADKENTFALHVFLKRFFFIMTGKWLLCELHS